MTKIRLTLLITLLGLASQSVGFAQSAPPNGEEINSWFKQESVDCDSISDKQEVRSCYRRAWERTESRCDLRGDSLACRDALDRYQSNNFFKFVAVFGLPTMIVTVGVPELGRYLKYRNGGFLLIPDKLLHELSGRESVPTASIADEPYSKKHSRSGDVTASGELKHAPSVLPVI